MTGNGWTELKTEEESITKPVPGHIIMASGEMGKEMAMEYFDFLTTSFTKALFQNRSSRVLGLRSSQMATTIKDNIRKANSMVRGSTVGQMDLLMKEILFKVAGMDKETGNRRVKLETYTLASMKMTRNVDMDAMCGRMAAFMKVISKTT